MHVYNDYKMLKSHVHKLSLQMFYLFEEYKASPVVTINNCYN